MIDIKCYENMKKKGQILTGEMLQIFWNATNLKLTTEKKIRV